MAQGQSNVVRGAFKDPQTKADLIDRMMRRDFTGDLADLAVDRNLKMERVRPHVMRLTFGHTGKQYDLVVHKPRPKGAAVSGAAIKAKGKRKAPNTGKRAGPGKQQPNAPGAQAPAPGAQSQAH